MLPVSLERSIAPVTLVTGHYGVGKTNLSLNLALDLAAAGNEVRLADLDIVNPYFRSSEYGSLLQEGGVTLVKPVMANSSLDTPSLSAEVDGAIEWARTGEGRVLIIDVGGDDAGATALGRYASRIAAGPYAMLYVINAYRNLTQTPDEAIEVLRQIHAACGLEATAIVNNSHLRELTDEESVTGTCAFGVEVAASTGIGLAAQTTPERYADGLIAALRQMNAECDAYPVQKLVKTPWE